MFSNMAISFKTVKINMPEVPIKSLILVILLFLINTFKTGHSDWWSLSTKRKLGK